MIADAGPEQPAQAAVARPSARVIVVGPGDVVLLFRFGEAGGAEGDSVWLTPGGGVRPGEGVAQAAARELSEETGIAVSVDQLGAVVAESRGQWSDGQTLYDALDSFFLLHVTETGVDTAGQEELERSLCREYRWWGLDELAGCTETVYPIGLAELVGSLMRGNRPTAPVELAWR